MQCLQRYLLRPFEILIKGPLRWFLGRLFSSDPHVFYGYERIPGREQPAAGGIVKLQDLTEFLPNSRWVANRLYVISSCYPWTVQWQVRLAKCFGAKVILNQNGVAYPAWKKVGWEAENERAKWVYERADFIIFQSAFCQRSADTFLGACKVPSRILMNPVDLSTFKVSKKFPSKEPCILLAGTHQFAYRVHNALETLAVLSKEEPKYHLHICGRYHWKSTEEEALDEARKWSRDLGVEDRVRFEGAYTQKQLPQLLDQADILLHTKVMDPCPRLVVEAMAAGIPVVYPRSGGLTEMISADAGIGVFSKEDYQKERPANPADFAEAIQRVMKNWVDYSRGARKCAEDRFDLKNWIEAHREIFRT